MKLCAIKLNHGVPDLVLVIHGNDELMASIYCGRCGKSHEQTSSVKSAVSLHG